MSAWDHLIEARIREWLAKSPEERMRTPESPLLVGLPMELQLMREVNLLDRAARDAADPAEAIALRERAAATMLRLMVLLEREGRHETARYFADNRLRLRDESD